jgi:malate synthase
MLRPWQRSEQVPFHVKLIYNLDKMREAKAGHDGTWVAHPDLVKIALEVFDDHMPGANQLYHQTPDATITAADLLDVAFPGTITDAGVATNAEISLLYTQAWLEGNGCVPIHGLMEDAATAEISRSQLYQWVRHGVRTREGNLITKTLVEGVIDGTVKKLGPSYAAAAGYLKGMVAECPEFITTTCYAAIVEKGVGMSKL